MTHVRPFAPEDKEAVRKLVAETWRLDPVMQRLHDVHGDEFDAPGRWRRTLVAVEAGLPVAAGTVVFTERHPSRLGLVVNVIGTVSKLIAGG